MIVYFLVKNSKWCTTPDKKIIPPLATSAACYTQKRGKFLRDLSHPDNKYPDSFPGSYLFRFLFSCAIKSLLYQIRYFSVKGYFESEEKTVRIA